MVFDASVLSTRIYSRSILLSFGKKISTRTLISIEDVNPYLPKLELRENKLKDMHFVSVGPAQGLSTFLSIDRQYEIFNESEISLNKKPSSYSDMSALLEKMSPSDIFKFSDFKKEEMRQLPTLRSIEEPLTSRMISRLKQIAIGKSLPEYKNYIKRVPLEERSPEDPKTPKYDSRLTKREFDNMYREWRIKLHQYGNEAISTTSTRVNSPENFGVCHEEYKSIGQINI